MGCGKCGAVEETVSAARAGSGTAAPRYYTGRQYIGSSGFDSPFDTPSPLLVPIPTPAPSLPAGAPLLLLAVLAVAIGYFYLERRT